MMLSEDKVSHLSHILLNKLYDLDLISMDEDEEASIRREIKRTIVGELKIGEEIDQVVRKKLLSLSKKLREGSSEWEVLYKKYYLGRGDKKGKGYWLKLAAVILVAAAWVSLLFDFPSRFPRIWFPVAAVVIVYCGALHLLAKRREHAIEFLYALIILCAGSIKVVGLPWLQLAYFPLIIGLTNFYSLKVIIPLSLLVPFTELKTFVITRENVAWQAAFSLFLILTSAVASFIFARLRSEKERTTAELEKIRTSAMDRTQDTEMESFGSDEIISH